jgi:hypothetical protein
VGGFDKSNSVSPGPLRGRFRRVTFFQSEKSHQKALFKVKVPRSVLWVGQQAVGAGPFGWRASRQPGWSCVAQANCRKWPWGGSGGLRSGAVTPRSLSAPAERDWSASEASGSDEPLSCLLTWERLPSRDAPLNQNHRGLETAPTSTGATCWSGPFLKPSRSRVRLRLNDD